MYFGAKRRYINTLPSLPPFLPTLDIPSRRPDLRALAVTSSLELSLSARGLTPTPHRQLVLTRFCLMFISKILQVGAGFRNIKSGANLTPARNNERTNDETFLS